MPPSRPNVGPVGAQGQILCEVADNLIRATLESVKFVALLIFDIPSNNNVNIMPPRKIFIPNPWAGVGPAGMQGYILH